MSLEMYLIDPDKGSRKALIQDCEEAGWNIRTFDSISDYLSSGGPEPETSLLILSLPKGWNDMNIESDIAEFEILHAQHPQTQLVLLLPEGCASSDHLALRLNARNTLFKPYDIEDLSKVLVMIASGTGKRKRMRALQNRMAAPQGFEEIIGASDKIKSVIALAQRIAESDYTSVMILGECGTGKGALAKAVHHTSNRSSGPFIEVNCAAIPRNLLESEFFGHEKGAFTDAKEEKIGLFECANGGTIFLDEVGEIDIGLQAKLLKFLDSRVIRRVSGTTFLPVDVRVMSATNRNLKEAVESKLFRADLYYRLNVVEIPIPPLRSRLEDIKPIAEAYTRRFADRLKKGQIQLTSQAVETLERYSWPGNIRELINIIERAVLLNNTGKIEPHDLPLPQEQQETTIRIKNVQDCIAIDLPPEGASLEDVEMGMIISALTQTGGNITKAARLLRVGRGTMRYKMKKYGIDPDEIKEKVKNGRNEPLCVTD